MKPSPVVHFEMPAKDTKRMSEFYANVFGWKSQFLGPEMNNYVMVQTSETHENGLPTEPGRINGGFFEYKDEEGARVPSIVIDVDNLETSMQEVKKHGGTIFMGPMEIPGYGLYASMKDTEGNIVGLLQAVTQMAKQE